MCCVNEARKFSEDEKEKANTHRPLSWEEDHKEENGRWRGSGSRLEMAPLALVWVGTVEKAEQAECGVQLCGFC